MLFKEIIAVYSENREENHTLYRQTAVTDS